MAKRDKPLSLDMDFDEANQRFAQTYPRQLEASKAGAGDDVIAKLTTPEGWGVKASFIAEQGQVRMDAEHYDPRILENMLALEESGFELVPLGEIADVALPSMFTRIWAQDSEHGIPYLNATDLMCYGALGEPSQERFLSMASNVNIENLLLKRGMILLTCSGTIGRVFEVPSELDGWVGTHDIVRITPKDPEMKGYTRAFLSSSFAQTQILSHTHGGQIDHITDAQVKECLVPLLPENLREKIAKQMNDAEDLREKAMGLIRDSMTVLNGAMKNAKK